MQISVVGRRLYRFCSVRNRSTYYPDQTISKVLLGCSMFQTLANLGYNRRERQNTPFSHTTPQTPEGANRCH
nr:MAG TPA: hypothetical protein [Caudoviricetes sp.]